MIQFAVFAKAFKKKSDSEGIQFATWPTPDFKPCFLHVLLMLPVETKIDRAQRLLRMIEQDAPLLAVRVAPLSRECQESAMSHAKSLAALTRQELQRLMKEKAVTESGDLVPQAAD